MLGSVVGKHSGDPLGELLQCLLVERVCSLKDRGIAAACLGAVHNENAVLCLISKPGSGVRVGGILSREHRCRDARVDSADLIELAAGTVQHRRVDVGLALHNESEFAVLIAVEIDLGSLDVLAALALHQDIVVVLADNARVYCIDAAWAMVS